MITHLHDGVLEIAVEDASTLEEHLNTAAEIARVHAMTERRHGILVTQHSFAAYTVAVSSDVPYGQTYERRAG